LDDSAVTKLWAPWRMEYILSEKEDKGCIFCIKKSKEKDKDLLILKRGKFSFVMMNKFPYNPGHLLIAPYEHISNLEDIQTETILEMMKLKTMSIKALKNVMSPEGFNIGMNLGKVAGAGVDDHLHIHIVPRWNGDTSFITVLSSAKVVSEALDATYDKLLNEFGSIK